MENVVELLYFCYTSLIFIFKESFVKLLWPVVLKLRPVEVVLEGVARCELHHHPQRLVAGVGGHLRPPPHLHVFYDTPGPEFSIIKSIKNILLVIDVVELIFSFGI